MNFNFDISNFINQLENNCSKIQRKNFSRGEVITTYIEKRNQLCLLVSGNAELIKYDLNGNRVILEHYNSNDIFGEIFYNVSINNELFVQAKTDCSVLFLGFDNFNDTCDNKCKFHDILINNFPSLFLNKIISLNNRIELLTKRSIRDKLLTYFNNISITDMSKSFSLPFSLTDLADYLGVDRSAMMRELRSLREEGFIKKSGNRITLLYK